MKTLPTLPPPLPVKGAHGAYHIAWTHTDLPTRKGVTYVWACNGIFMHAWNGKTRALLQISHHDTPGLGAVQSFISWRGWPTPLPAALLNAALTDALARYRPEAPHERQWFIVLSDGVPTLVTPEQQTSRMRVSYQMPAGQVLADIHSHHGMPPYFSGTDDADDAWLGLSVVIGRLGSPYPSAVARINCYGHHHDHELALCFAGDLRAGDLALIPEREAVRREGGGGAFTFDRADEVEAKAVEAEAVETDTERAFDKQAAIRGYHEDEDTDAPTTAAGQ